MDTLSHGLWGGVAFGRKNRPSFWLSFFFGLMPDFLSFGPFMIGTILSMFNRPEFSGQRHPTDADIPTFVHNLYSITHSLIVFLILFLVIWLINKKPFLPLLAWGLHILMDIPTHDKLFFPTPFLWPVSNFTLDGVSWGTPYIMIPDIVLLAMVYVVFFIRKKKSRFC
jgi:membrane-bound metal-dependent hydrolase YbcI (DUF457 family)